MYFFFNFMGGFGGPKRSLLKSLNVLLVKYQKEERRNENKQKYENDNQGQTIRPCAAAC